MTEQPLKLNIGGGDTELDGFVCVDRTNGKEAFPLEYEDESVDEVRASHVLEHFGWKEAIEAIKEWVRVLKPGGLMRIAVPDFAFIAEQYSHADETRNSDKLRSMVFSYAMGGQIDENDFHKSAWDEQRLRGLMQAAGIHRIERWESEIDDYAKLPVSLNLKGTKQPDPVIPKISAIMSTGRLAFTENLFCSMHTFAPRGIELIKHTGAFWGQCLERVMVDCLTRENKADRPEWFLTLDYDTVFTPEQFDLLCYEMATHPEIDALAPWQCKREDDAPLCWFIDEEGNKREEIPLTEFDKDVIQVRDAHFGLTLIRVSALEKMEHPWFLEQPNDKGMWGDGRLDPDIYFWRKWQKAGNNLFLANRVSIGHCQQMVTWIRKDTRRPIHQYLTEFQKHGPPKEVPR